MRISKLNLGILMLVTGLFRASVGMAEDARDPFWPVGYRPHAVVAVVSNVVAKPVETKPIEIKPVEEPKPDPLVIMQMAAALQAKIKTQLRVGAFMKSGDHELALVNGQIVAEGDKLSVSVDGQTYRFKIKAISASSVNLEPVE